MSVTGYYINCDDALCITCFRKPSHLPKIMYATIHETEESDTPTHCIECERLIFHWLSDYGETYVCERCMNREGRPEILAMWRHAYAPTFTCLTGEDYWPEEKEEKAG